MRNGRWKAKHGVDMVRAADKPMSRQSDGTKQQEPAMHHVQFFAKTIFGKSTLHIILSCGRFQDVGFSMWCLWVVGFVVVATHCVVVAVS